MSKVIISEFMDENAVNKLREDFDVLYDQTLFEYPDKLIKLTHDADALVVRNQTRVTQALVDGAAKLRVLGRIGVGLDNIDLDACAANNIKVCPAFGANEISVAEYVITNALMLLRTSYFSYDKMLAGDWPRWDLMGNEVYGKTMGLIGLGSIARQVAKRAMALNMKVAAFDPYVGREDDIWNQVEHCQTIDELLSFADIVSLHIPLNDSTRHLIDKTAINKMQSHAIIINTARGGVIDEDALAEALRNETIAGAALDVFESEPLSKEAAEKYRGLRNLILTPHIAGVTKEANIRASAITARNVRNELMGEE